MGLEPLPLNSSWIKEELVPYLRHAFAHELTLEEDIGPAISRAIDFVNEKQCRHEDANDSVFERVYLAVQFRDKNLAPGLSVVTDNLENMAKFLLRRAQVKGSYELLGRMYTVTLSNAWFECEAPRLPHGERAVKEKDEGSIRLPQSPSKGVITEEQTDPRPIDAVPGQFGTPLVLKASTVPEDQYFRLSDDFLSEYLEDFDTTAPYLGPEAMTYGRVTPQEDTSTNLAAQTFQPSLVQDFEQPEFQYPVETMSGNNGVDTSSLMSQAMPLDSLQKPCNASSSAQPTIDPLLLQYETPSAYWPDFTTTAMSAMSNGYLPDSITATAVPTANMLPGATAMPATSSTETAIPTANMMPLQGGWSNQGGEQRGQYFGYKPVEQQAHQSVQVPLPNVSPNVQSHPSSKGQSKLSMSQHSDPVIPKDLSEHADSSSTFEPIMYEPLRPRRTRRRTKAQQKQRARRQSITDEPEQAPRQSITDESQQAPRQSIMDEPEQVPNYPQAYLLELAAAGIREFHKSMDAFDASRRLDLL